MRTPRELLGESPDRLSLPEREHFLGWWIALEIYTPQTLPLRLICALAESPAECMDALLSSGRDPAQFEFVQLQKH